MRPLLNRLAAEVRLAQRVVCRRRMMGSYAASEELTLRERASVNHADMDSLPSPSGDWATENAKLQSKYNISLAVSIALSVAMVYYFLSLKLVKKPDRYAPFNLEEWYQARLAERE